MQVIAIRGLSRNKSLLTYFKFKNVIEIPNIQPKNEKAPSIVSRFFLVMFLPTIRQIINVIIINKKAKLLKLSILTPSIKLIFV